MNEMGHEVRLGPPFANPDIAARKLIEIANGVEAVQDDRIYIERVNAPYLASGGSGNDFGAGIARTIAQGWLWRHESGTYVKFTDSGAALFAYYRVPKARRRSRSPSRS